VRDVTSFATAVVLLACVCACAHTSRSKETEHYDLTHCRTAIDAGDNANIETYCRALAGDYAADVAGETGRARTIDLLLEGTSLGAVGYAANLDSDDHSAGAGYFNQARDLFNEALKDANGDKWISRRAKLALEHLPVQP
jgi:hypothetical protein